MKLEFEPLDILSQYNKLSIDSSAGLCVDDLFYYANKAYLSQDYGFASYLYYLYFMKVDIIGEHNSYIRFYESLKKCNLEEELIKKINFHLRSELHLKVEDLITHLASSNQKLINVKCFFDSKWYDFQSELREIIEEFIELVVFKTFSCLDEAGHFKSYEKPTKIIVSGMGWSGSGALFDYFSQFSKVKVVDGEARYIEGGSSSLLKIYDKINKNENHKEVVLRFFFHNCLGLGALKDTWDFKYYRTGYRNSNAKDNGKYLQALKYLLPFFAKLYHSKDNEKLANFSLFANHVVDLLSCSQYEDDSKPVVLLDNCVHIGNLRAAKFIDNAYFFPTMRDPRDIYSSMEKEAKFFSSIKDDFVASNKGRSESLEKTIMDAASRAQGSSRVIRVQFEKFVLDSNYRDQLVPAGLLGTLESDKFKPDISMNNIHIFEHNSIFSDLEFFLKFLKLEKSFYKGIPENLFDKSKFRLIENKEFNRLDLLITASHSYTDTSKVSVSLVLEANEQFYIVRTEPLANSIFIRVNDVEQAFPLDSKLHLVVKHNKHAAIFNIKQAVSFSNHWSLVGSFVPPLDVMSNESETLFVRQLRDNFRLNKKGRLSEVGISSTKN